MTRPYATFTLLVALALAAAACGEDSTVGPVPTVPGAGSVSDTTPRDLIVSADAPFPADRCQANRSAGKITYLSSFDFAASASIVDVVVAAKKGYYADLCLDVVLKSSFSVDNYPLIASNEAQFSSAGAFGELVDFAGRNDAQFVALSVEGRTGIDALITHPGAISTLADVKGKKIGIKGALTASVKAMLLTAGLVEGQDYETVPMEGFDPIAQFELPEIIGFPGYKSNEPKQLDAAGIPYTLFDPAEFGIPGSFGVIYSNASFVDAHPTAAEDFMRATMRGLADAIADPLAAAQASVDLINANGNALFLSPAGEIARWGVESELVADPSFSSDPPGVPVVSLLQREVETYGAIGVFDGITPDFSTMVDLKMVAALYDKSGTVIWPASTPPPTTTTTTG